MSNFKQKILDFVHGEKSEIEIEEEIIEEKKVPKHHEVTISERIYNDIEKGKSTKTLNKFYVAVSIILSIVIIGSLLYCVTNLPNFGDPANPANNIVSGRYIEKGIEEGGATNLVGNMILDYRAFDTLGESHVLFIAASAVIILLMRTKTKKEEDEETKDEETFSYKDKHDPILRKGALLIVPAVLMFGVYVVLNGHLSPGGGFSGGAIMGAAFILYNLSFGDHSTEKFINTFTYRAIIISALGFYAFSKSYSFFTGANQIHSIIPNGVPGDILSSGLILPLNIAVGIIVSLTMFGFYSLFDREEI